MGNRYGLSSLRAAEVKRGAIFSEPLTSLDSVIKNGGVIGSGVKFVSPKEGFKFNGISTSNILYGDLLRQNLTGITISFWVKYAIPGFATLTSLVGQAVGAVYRTEIFTNTGDLFFYVCVDGVGRYAQHSLTNVTDGNWHHVTGTWYSGSYVRLYVDGVLVASSAATHAGTIVVADAVKDFTIGAWPSGGCPFNGEMRNCMVFNTALGADEIAAYYNGSMFKYDDFCVCDLPFDIAHHDTVNKRSLDVSGYNNHATWGDGVTSTTFPTKLAGRGYSFDGGDYMRTPVVPTERTCVFVQGYYPTTGSTRYLFGSAGADRYYLRYVTPTEILAFGLGGSTTSTTKKIDDGMIRSILMCHDTAKNAIYSDGVLIYSDAAVRVAEKTYPLFIGCLNSSGSATGLMVAGSKLFSFKIYQGLYLNQIQYLDLDMKSKECLSKC